jgi:hypothetical protein
MKDTASILNEYIIKPKGNFFWKDIPEYEGLYQISNHGDLRRVKERLLTVKGSSLVLTDRSGLRQSVSVKKVVTYCFAPHERYEGKEFWLDMPNEFYGKYKVSNYGNFKTCEITPMSPSNKSRGCVVLIKTRGGKPRRETISIVRLFLNTFPPYEVNINEEDKQVSFNRHGKP